MNWISVKDALPAKSGETLVFLVDKCDKENCPSGLGQRYDVAQFVADLNIWINLDRFSKVSHWAPLSKPVFKECK